MRLPTATGHQVDQMLPVVATVGNDGLRHRQSLDQGRSGGLVGGMASCQQQPDRQALLINYSVYLGTQSSTRTADGVIRTPFFHLQHAGGPG